LKAAVSDSDHRFVKAYRLRSSLTNTRNRLRRATKQADDNNNDLTSNKNTNTGGVTKEPRLKVDSRWPGDVKAAVEVEVKVDSSEVKAAVVAVVDSGSGLLSR
jgi:hypothetical protein